MPKLPNIMQFTKEWIDSVPKTINNNGCWISFLKSDSKGYVRISTDKGYFVLSRLSMCIIYDINYYNKKVVARHNTNCDKGCFYYKHLQPGTDSDNQLDNVRDKKHWETAKLLCPKCGGNYRTVTYKTGWNKGKTKRYCPICKKVKNA